jgi:hypothetical protein
MSYTFLGKFEQNMKFSCNCLEYKISAGGDHWNAIQKGWKEERNNSAHVCRICCPQWWLSIKILVRVHMGWSYYVSENKLKMCSKADVPPSNH